MLTVQTVSEAYWLEELYWWSQAGLAAAVILTGIVAWCQLSDIRKSRKHAARVAHANFLLDLDKRWEGPDMLKPRATMRRMQLEIGAQIAASHPNATDQEKRQHSRDAFTKALGPMRTQDFDEYEKLLQMWGLFETVGHLVKEGYVELKEIDSLFGHIIIQLDDVSRGHIAIREQEETARYGRQVRLYENFLMLADDLRKLV